MKSFVTISVCPICRKETGSLLLDRRMREKFEMHTVNPTEVCKECREKYLVGGVMIINPQSGRLAVLKNKAFRGLFNIAIPKNKICFAEEAVFNRLNLP